MIMNNRVEDFPPAPDKLADSPLGDEPAAIFNDLMSQAKDWAVEHPAACLAAAFALGAAFAWIVKRK